MAKKKRHHFIPQFYLKGFCDPHTPPRQAPFLWVSSRHGNGVFRRGPNNLASENGYYICEGLDADRMENELSMIESRAAFALRAFLHQPTGNKAIPEELGSFIGWLGARTPSFRRIAQEGWTDFLLNAPWGTGELPAATKHIVSLQHVHTGEVRREPVNDAIPLLRSSAWKAVLEQNEYVDIIRQQAWYFGNRLPSLKWITADSTHWTKFHNF